MVVASTVMAHGLDGLVLATLLSGGMLIAAGVLGLGTYIKFIPFPVTVGFTAGIAVIIFASQIVPLLGLTLTGSEPGRLLPKLSAIWFALPTLSAATLSLSLLSIAGLIILRRLRPHWPRMLIVVSLAAIVGWELVLPVATITSAFGGIPAGFPRPALPAAGMAEIRAVLPNALSFTLLGAIESLLSAVVADGMTGRRHRSNMELIAQGIANIGSALFGGICVTGTIARTATNVRAGAHGPVSGIAHSLFLLVFVLVAAPLAGYIPLAALAAVLAVVAWDMVEKPALRALLSASRGDAAVLIVTLGLTLFRDLTEAIVVGFALGAMLFINRMSRAVAVNEAPATPYRPDAAADPQAVIYRVTGAVFFGAVSAVASALDRIGDSHRVLIIDFSGVTLVEFLRRQHDRGTGEESPPPRSGGISDRSRSGAPAGTPDTRRPPAAGPLRPDHRLGAGRRPAAGPSHR